ncbi:MAG: hypothetical protein ACK4V1_03385 [Burkholderiaceae bacterium]
MKPYRLLSTTLACLILVGFAPAHAQGGGDAHRAEDRARHQKIAAAHEAAAACLQGKGDAKACQEQLRADCRGLAVGTHCGLRSGPDGLKDAARRIDEHRRMAAIHTAAAQCLAGDKPYRECLAQLGKDCGGLGVGKYCGMRHAH